MAIVNSYVKLPESICINVVKHGKANNKPSPKSPQMIINWYYKASPNGWFIVGCATLHKYFNATHSSDDRWTGSRGVPSVPDPKVYLSAKIPS